MPPTKGFLDEIDHNPGPKSKIEVEVILHKKQELDYVVQADEGARIRNIPRRGVKILKECGKIATLRLSEAKAVEYSLV